MFLWWSLLFSGCSVRLTLLCHCHMKHCTVWKHCNNILKHCTVGNKSKSLHKQKHSLWQVKHCDKALWQSSGDTATPQQSGLHEEHAWKGSKVLTTLGINQVLSGQIWTQKNISFLYQIIIWYSNEISKSKFDRLERAKCGKKR